MQSSHTPGRFCSRAKLRPLFFRCTPAQTGSLIPSDHAGPNPRSHRSYCSCSGTARQVFSRRGSEYLVRNGNDVDNRPVQQPSQRIMSDYRPTSSGRDGDLVAMKRALSELKSSIRPSTDRAWRRAAALRVIDCVLSLHRPYDSFVVPRLDDFEREFPNVRTVADLRNMIATYPSPNLFMARCLDYCDDARSLTLAKVVDWLTGIAGGGDYQNQILNIER